MYTLNVKNNYIWPISASDNTVIEERGGSHTFTDLGSTILSVMGMGAFNFMDLGDTKLPGYPATETWGVLVRTHATEAYYRYEGGGELSATFDVYGTCTLSTNNGTLIPVSLEELVVDASGIPTT